MLYNVLFVISYRCYERHILDVIFERYREADVAVEECEHQLKDLNMLSVRTQRPLKILFKPQDFSGGSYISETDAAASTVTAAKTVSAAARFRVYIYLSTMLKKLRIIVDIDS
jgi:hypothetical protein